MKLSDCPYLHCPKGLHHFTHFHCPESTTMSMILIHFLATSLLLFTTIAIPSQHTEAGIAAVYWSIMPIVGALGASLMAVLLNRVTENRRAVIGRVIGATASGVGIPRILTKFHPWLEQVTLDPIILILMGFICGLFGYAAAVYVVDKFFSVAPSIVDREFEKFTEVVSEKTSDKMVKKITEQKTERLQ